MFPAWNPPTGAILLLFLIAEVWSYRSVKTVTNDVSYRELIKLNATCPGLDSCQVHRRTDDLHSFNCHCGPMCTELGTCCVDSRYRRPGGGIPSNAAYCALGRGSSTKPSFFINECSPNWNGDDFVKDLCVGDPATLNDPFLLVHVSNLRTGLTYGNFFCFICNNPTPRLDSPSFWNLKFFSESPNISQNSFPQLKYGDADWKLENNYVYIGSEIPRGSESRLIGCRQNVWESCSSDWTDDVIKKKCESYTAIVSFPASYGTKRYKNPHCAICNNEDLSKRICNEKLDYSDLGRPPYGYLFNGLFSLEDKVKRCPRNQVFDKFSNKCRPFRCGRNRQVVDGECV